MGRSVRKIDCVRLKSEGSLKKKNKVCVTVSILLSFIWYLREISKDLLAPGDLYSERRFNGGILLPYEFRVLMFFFYVWSGSFSECYGNFSFSHLVI